MATVSPRSAKPGGDELVQRRAGREQRGGERVGEQRGEPVVGGLRLGREPGDDLQLALAQAGGDLQAGQLGVVLAQDDGQLRLQRAPEPHGLLAQLARGRPAPAAPDRRRPRPATCPAAPPAGRAGRAPVGPCAPRPAGRRGRARCRPAPAPSRRPGTRACFRTPAAVASGSARQPRRAISRSTIAGDPLLQGRVDRRRAPLELADDLGGEVVGRRARARRR